jgi:hypothetical protein
MEAAVFFETSVNLYRTACHYFLSSQNFVKGFTFQNHRDTEIDVISETLGLYEIEALRISKQSAHEGGRLSAQQTGRLYPQDIFLLLTFVRG